MTTMKPDDFSTARRQAELSFRRARKQAWRKQLRSWLSGREQQHLLPFEPIRAELPESDPRRQGVKLVPVDKIVGSVSRYEDFTRQFLPLKDSLRERWINVESLAMRRGWPPVELYQLGDVYFVSDGNHRVAVARQMGNDTIEAYVWSFPNIVQIDPEEPLDELLIRLGEQHFMELTGLAQRHPDHGIRFTTPGRYRELLVQIEELRHTLAIIDGEPMAYEEAVDAWFEMIYLPSVQIIADSNILEAFPGRTEADLFVWLSVHREILREHYGDYERLADLVDQVAQDWQPQGLEKIYHRIIRLIGRSAPPSPLPDIQEPGPQPNNHNADATFTHR